MLSVLTLGRSLWEKPAAPLRGRPGRGPHGRAWQPSLPLNGEVPAALAATLTEASSETPSHKHAANLLRSLTRRGGGMRGRWPWPRAKCGGELLRGSR